MEREIPHSIQCLMQSLRRKKVLNNVRILSDNASGYILRLDGRKRYFRYTQNDLNPVGAYNIAKYKHLTKEVLGEASIKVPDGLVVRKNDNLGSLKNFVKSHGFPLVVKPASLSKGEGVQVVHNGFQLFNAVESTLKIDETVLVEKFVEGVDYRLLVFKDRMVCAFSKKTNDKYKPSNLSLGGKANDVTKSVSKYFSNLAVQIANELNLTICGIDIKIEGEISDEKNRQYCVLEVNSAPDNSYFAKLGPKQNKIIQELYDQILESLMEA